MTAVIRQAGLAALSLTVSACSCSEVIVEDGDGSNGASTSADYPYTCEGICQRRFDELNCSLAQCGGGCTQEVFDEIAAVECSEEFLAWLDCATDATIEVGNFSCSDGCPTQPGLDWAECQDKLAAAKEDQP